VLPAAIPVALNPANEIAAFTPSTLVAPPVPATPVEVAIYFTFYFIPISLVILSSFI